MSLKGKGSTAQPAKKGYSYSPDEAAQEEISKNSRGNFENDSRFFLNARDLPLNKKMWFRLAPVPADVVEVFCGKDITKWTLGIQYFVSTFNCSDYSCTLATHTEDDSFSMSDAASSDEAGREKTLAIDEDGDVIAVGAYQEDTGGATSGTVYIFTGSGSYTEVQIIRNPGTAGANFGKGLALSKDGNTLVVGAPVDTSSQGKVYVYVRTATTWDLTATLQSATPVNGDLFGQDVDINALGTRLLIGANGEEKAYIFDLIDDVWTENVNTLSPSLTAGGAYGFSVSLSRDGNYAAVGDYLNDTGTANEGAVFVYYTGDDDAGTWAEQAALQRTGAVDAPRAGDNYGYSVCLDCDGDVLLVGSPGARDPVALWDPAGICEIVKRTGTSWAIDEELVHSVGNAYGSMGMDVQLSADGSIAYCGAPEYGTGFSARGRVFVFLESGGSWSESESFEGSTTANGDWFGRSVALSIDGNILAVGAPRDDNGAGNAGVVFVNTMCS